METVLKIIISACLVHYFIAMLNCDSIKGITFSILFLGFVQMLIAVGKMKV